MTGFNVYLINETCQRLTDNRQRQHVILWTQWYTYLQFLIFITNEKIIPVTIMIYVTFDPRLPYVLSMNFLR